MARIAGVNLPINKHAVRQAVSGRDAKPQLLTNHHNREVESFARARTV